MKTVGMIFPALFIVFFNNVTGQVVYFDNLYGETETGGGVGGEGTQMITNGYSVWSTKFQNNRWSLYPFTTNVQGDLLQDLQWELPDTMSEQAGNSIKLDDSTFIGMFMSSVLAASDTAPGDFALLAYNFENGLIWKKTYGMIGRRETPLRVRGVPTGGFIIVGQVSLGADSDAEADVHLMRISSSGDFLWEKSLGGSDYDTGNDLVNTPDLGFLLLGWTRSFGAGQKDFYLVKTDSAGNQQWQKTYGAASNDGGAGILELADGNYLLVGGTSPDGVTSVGRIYKVDSAGTVIWQKNYGMQSGNSLFKTVELADGSLVSAGLTTTSGESNAGYLIKTDSEGTLLWQRKYNKSNSVDLFYSILATDDGGFLLSGQANDINGNQDAWLLKVDSVGCPYPNCMVGIDETEKTKVVVDVWPNPAGEYVRLQVTGNRQQHEMRITVTDMQGRSYSPPAQEGTGLVGTYLEVDVRAWPNGLYIFTVENGNERARVRVVVQH